MASGEVAMLGEVGDENRNQSAWLVSSLGGCKEAERTALPCYFSEAEGEIEGEMKVKIGKGAANVSTLDGVSEGRATKYV